MREIALDTETTGLDPASGHRVVEIGCVEMKNRLRTGEIFHAYINPEIEMPMEAFNIHGLSTEFLAGKPTFNKVVKEFLGFIGNAPLVIHNVGFDLKFLNAELAIYGHEPLEYSRTVDTLKIARNKFPGSPASLDALCRRFEIDLSSRAKHGALLDAELLADMYLELMGGSQVAFELGSTRGNKPRVAEAAREKLAAREHLPSKEEQESHQEFLSKLKKPLWAN